MSPAPTELLDIEALINDLPLSAKVSLHLPIQYTLVEAYDSLSLSC